MTALSKILDALEKESGAPIAAEPKGPLAQVLYENVAYLASDEKRAAAFDALRKRVGLDAKKILAAPPSRLREATALGGIMPDLRVGKLLRIAEIALHDFGGDLRPVLELPLARAKKALMKFPSIGAPGAEKILMLAGSHAVLALDSNALRVLLRLGYGEEKKSYAQSHALTQQAAAAELPQDAKKLSRAFRLLRRHGQEVCRRNRPLCPSCAVRKSCRFYREGVPR